MSVKYSKNAALKAQRSASIKSAKLPVGATLTVLEVIANDSSDENLNRDELLCVKTDGKKLRIPVREFMNMAAEGDLFKNAEEDDKIIFPSAITVVAAKDRMTNRTGTEQPVYPIQAYKAGAAQITARKFDFDALLASGLKDDWSGDPVQDYTIKSSF